MSAEDAQTKCCSDCGQSKPVTDFHRSARRADGLHGYCKSCNKRRAADWRAVNPERVKATEVAFASASHGPRACSPTAVLRADGGGVRRAHG